MPRNDPGLRLLRLWRRLHRVPGGRWLFGRILGWWVPYSGRLGATVLELQPGRVRIGLEERRAVRNHLRSVHAVALTNLGELTTGLATLTTLQPGVRGIVVSLSTEYRKKARGHLVAECHTAPPDLSPDVGDDVEHEAVAEIRDRQDDVVAVVRAGWRMGRAGTGQGPP